MSQNHDHVNKGHDLELDRDLAEVVRVYRGMGQDLPSPAVDDAIRAAARRAVHAGPRALKKSWWMSGNNPLAAAAVVVLVVSVGLLSIDEKPEWVPVSVRDAVKTSHAEKAAAGTARTPAPSHSPRDISPEIDNQKRPEPMAMHTSEVGTVSTKAAPAQPGEIEAMRYDAFEDRAPLAKPYPNYPKTDKETLKEEPRQEQTVSTRGGKGQALIPPPPPPATSSSVFEPAPAAPVSIPAPFPAESKVAQGRQASDKIEKIEVTGSSISRIDVESPSPVVVISQEELGVTETASTYSGKNDSPEKKREQATPAATTLGAASSAAYSYKTESAAGSVVERSKEKAKAGHADVAPSVKDNPLAKEAESLPPQEWLKRIQALRKEGKMREADEEFAKFRKRYPDHPLPAEEKK